MLTQCIYALIGSSFLWPYNAFMTASGVAQSRLHERLFKYYSSFMLVVLTISGLACNLILTLKTKHYKQRVLGGELLIAVTFIVLSILSLHLNNKPWLYSMMSAAFLASIGSALVQNGVMAITQNLENDDCALAVMIGQGFSGVLPPLLALMLNNLSSVKNAAITNSIVILVSLSSFFSFKSKRNKTYKLIETTERQLNKHEFSSLVETNKVPYLTVLLSLAVSLNYPVFANQLDSPKIPLKIFSPLTHIIWNLGDLTGRAVCVSPKYRVTSRPLLVSYTWLRTIFVVTLLYTKLPSWIYLVWMFGYGFSGGHSMSCAVSMSMERTPPQLQLGGGGVLTLIMSMGLVFGSISSVWTTKLMSNQN